MELPEDILAIVRAYAKPRFLYFREYNRTLRMLGVDTFPALKKILCETPERLLSSLERLENAHIAFQHIYKDFEQRYLEYFETNQVWIKRTCLSNAMYEFQLSRTSLFSLVKSFKNSLANMEQNSLANMEQNSLANMEQLTVSNQ